MKKEQIKQLTKKDNNNLNIYHNERRLILLAILKAKGDLEQAYNINAPSSMTFEAYRKKVYRYGVRKKFLKSLFNSK